MILGLYSKITLQFLPFVHQRHLNKSKMADNKWAIIHTTCPFEKHGIAVLLVTCVTVGFHWCADTWGQRKQGRKDTLDSSRKERYVSKCIYDSSPLLLHRHPRANHIHTLMRGHTYCTNLLWQQPLTPKVVTWTDMPWLDYCFQHVKG